MKKYDVISICNALVDILVQVEDKDLENLSLTKANMHLVDAKRQGEVLNAFENHDQHIELGGSAMNAIRSLAALGKSTAFAGMVSDDAFGERILKRMNDLGIKAHLGKTHEPTGSCVVLVTPDGERTMNTHLGASRLYTKDIVPHSDIKEAKILHFCGYQFDTEEQMNAIRDAIKTAKENQTLISFDVADPFVVGRFQEEFKRLIKEDADIVFANREEAKMLYGHDDPYKTAAEITKNGAIAAIKLGAEGALVAKGDASFKLDPVATTVVDTTAAGDMFAAGFLAGFVSDKNLEDCGRMATKLASDVISRLGAHVSEQVIEDLKASL